MLPTLNFTNGDETGIIGYISSNVHDSLRIYFSLDNEGDLWWSIFMDNQIVADNRIPVKY